MILITEKKPDDVMAEYLLKGAKMLAKTCPACGSPMFTYKDRTFCVMCELEDQKLSGPAGKQPRNPVALPNEEARVHASAHELACALETTLITLSGRIATEPDPGRCLSLMSTIKIGIEALKLLSQP